MTIVKYSSYSSEISCSSVLLWTESLLNMFLPTNCWKFYQCGCLWLLILQMIYQLVKLVSQFSKGTISTQFFGLKFGSLQVSETIHTRQTLCGLQASAVLPKILHEIFMEKLIHGEHIQVKQK